MDKKKIGIIGGGIAGAALGYYLSLYEGKELHQDVQLHHIYHKV